MPCCLMSSMHSPTPVERLTVIILDAGVMRSPTVHSCVVSVASALTKSRSDMMPITEPSVALLTMSAPMRLSQKISAHALTVSVSLT